MAVTTIEGVPVANRADLHPQDPLQLSPGWSHFLHNEPVAKGNRTMYRRELQLREVLQ